MHILIHRHIQLHNAYFDTQAYWKKQGIFLTFRVGTMYLISGERFIQDALEVLYLLNCVNIKGVNPLIETTLVLKVREGIW